MHGAADGAPGLFLDRFADTLVAHADSHAVLERWLPVLRREYQVDREAAQALYLADPGQADARHSLADPGQADALHSPPRFSSAVAKVHPREANRARPAELTLWGDPPEELTVTERGVRYLIKPKLGLNVGLFLDMREVRSWLRAISNGKTVLNLFAYTCSLGLCAALAGASRVLNLDLSRQYLQWGQQNYAHNGLQTTDEDFVYGDAFDWLGRFARRQQTFDIVVADPPSFSSHRGRAFTVEHDYPRLVEAAARCVAHGGMLLVATNHAGTTDARFDAWLRGGLDMAERYGAIERRWHEPLPDFPLLPGQRSYLKVRALVLD